VNRGQSVRVTDRQVKNRLLVTVLFSSIIIYRDDSFFLGMNFQGRGKGRTIL